MAPIKVRRRRRRSGLPTGVTFAKVLTVLEEAARSQGDGVLWVDEKGLILVSNPAIGRMLNIPEARLKGEPLGKLDPLFSGDNWEQHWDMVCRHGPLTYESALRLEGGQATSVEVELTLSAVSLGGNRILSVVAREVGHRRNAEREIIAAKRVIEEATRLKNEFLVALSHQIRTPLNSVMGATSLLLEEVEDPELLGLVRIVMRGERQLLGTLGGMGEVVQIEKRLQGLAYEAVDVAALARQVMEELRAEALEQRLELEVIEVEPDLRAWAASSLVHDILRRLVTNAVRYTENGRVGVRIKMCEEGIEPRIQVVVEDSGPGMDPEFVARIFKPLVQDPQKRPRLESHGLGLAVAHLLARVQNGTLRAESVKGEGSRFILTLPTARAQA